ncbi:MAG: GT-D fold domain-containing protein [Lachnospiraceae bacterium]|nr:GT-D fold domain-containing protein [Lachnospiraceae bacterium]
MDDLVKVIIWGVGRRCNTVLDTLNSDCCEIAGFIDNDPQKAGGEYRNKKIYTFQEISDDFDYLLVAALSYKSIIYELERYGFDMDRLIVFYDMSYIAKRECWEFIDWKAWKIAVLEERLKELESVVRNGLSNIGYEIIDKSRKNKYCYPVIGGNEELVDQITTRHKSFIRFGDGEFELMRGNERAPFQKVDMELSKRLLEIFTISDEKILTGISNTYGDLDQYTEEIAQGIREYMTEETRAFHLSVIDSDRTYYDAYLFKSYMPYKDKENTEKRISLLRKIWDGRDIVFIEGDKTRTGYGNDLFDNAKSVKRILCPTFNAYSKYDEILACGKKVDKGCLILMVLGPAGKVLAYDLVQEGYQVVDIGQIDMDYDWYLAGAGFKVPNPNKYVSQLPPSAVNEITDDAYREQILFRIE